jgi:hypothetical protein
VIVADDGVEMVEVPTEKFALIAPAGTINDAGTWTNPGLLLVRVTRAPPPGAAAVRETVPVGCPWLFTDDWLSDTADRAAPNPDAEAGGDGFDEVGGVGLGEGEDGVPLPQPVSRITRLVVNRYGNQRRSEVLGICAAAGATRSPVVPRRPRSQGRRHTLGEVCTR